MPFDLQTRLLRVLSDGHFYRVGGHNSVKANVRVIAATHQDLEQRVKEGGFREDLFHRLNVIRLRLPALRERREDIPMLTRHFLQQSAQQLGVEAKRISEPALAQMAQFAFPGNVRQLENICHWLTVMAPAQVIERKDLPPEVGAASASAASAQALSIGSGSNSAATASHHGAAPHSAASPLGGSVAGGSVPGTPPVSAADALVRSAADPWPAGASAEMGSIDTELGSDLALNRVGPSATASVDRSGQNAGGSGAWEDGLESEAVALLATGRNDVWDALCRRFESRLIRTALANTRGRRIEAAQRLGIGRNTITRKIQELGLDD
jgi:two-component system nitrogen regulation response regulator GlnG